MSLRRRTLFVAGVTLVTTLLALDRRGAVSELTRDLRVRRAAILDLERGLNTPSPGPRSSGPSSRPAPRPVPRQSRPRPETPNPPSVAELDREAPVRPAPEFFAVPEMPEPVRPEVGGTLRTSSTFRAFVRYDEQTAWVAEGESFRGWQAVHITDREVVLYFPRLHRAVRWRKAE